MVPPGRFEVPTPALGATVHHVVCGLSPLTLVAVRAAEHSLDALIRWSSLPRFMPRREWLGELMSSRPSAKRFYSPDRRSAIVAVCVHLTSPPARFFGRRGPRWPDATRARTAGRGQSERDRGLRAGRQGAGAVHVAALVEATGVRWRGRRSPPRRIARRRPHRSPAPPSAGRGARPGRSARRVATCGSSVASHAGRTGPTPTSTCSSTHRRVRGCSCSVASRTNSRHSCGSGSTSSRTDREGACSFAGPT